MEPTTYMKLTDQKRVVFYVSDNYNRTAFYATRSAAESAWKKGLVKRGLA